MQLHPIGYSLIVNILALAIAGLLSWDLKNPLLFILVIVLQTHALQKFQDNTAIDAGNDDDFPERPIGFTADIK